MRRVKERIARSGPCPNIWGSHSCRKQKNHRGRCYCSNGCTRGVNPVYPEDTGRDRIKLLAGTRSKGL